MLHSLATGRTVKSWHAQMFCLFNHEEERGGQLNLAWGICNKKTRLISLSAFKDTLCLETFTTQCGTSTHRANVNNIKTPNVIQKLYDKVREGAGKVVLKGQ